MEVNAQMSGVTPDLSPAIPDGPVQSGGPGTSRGTRVTPLRSDIFTNTHHSAAGNHRTCADVWLH